jgi:histidinol-phosphate aminotransferase
MGKFMSNRYRHLKPYIPGEQPKDKIYIKLNANETSRPPSPKVLEVLKSDRMKQLGMYTDPHSRELKKAVSDTFDVSMAEIFVGNGSDEILGYIFLTFFENKHICYPDITYSFYATLALALDIDAEEIKLKKDFTIDINQFIETNRHIILANPNAPTGYALSIREIEKIVRSKPDRLVIVDEAYIDYGNESSIPLVKKYDNLMVIHTMSKSRNLAGAHIGYCIANKKLIADIESIKSVLNPFNLSDISMAVGTAAMLDRKYLQQTVQAVIEARIYITNELRKMNFYVLESNTNFVFVSHPWLSAEEYNIRLKEHGILARHYKKPDRIRNFLRITVGTMLEMAAVVQATRKILLSLAA